MSSHPSRRTVLGAGVGLAAAAATAGIASAAPRPAPLPAPAASGIDHIVVLMMENRSFDHFLGWLPGANGRQQGLTYTDRAGVPHRTYPLRPDFQGCSHPDPDHSYEGGRSELNGGRCDGWLRTSTNDTFTIGYYTDADLPFFGQAARAWTVCDNYFSATMAETYPNRFYQHAAQTDRTHNSTATATMPTIWDRLAAAGLQGRYYFSDVPFTALWGTKYLPISRPFPEFLAACAAGTLPEVSFVDPRFTDESSGSSADDHPHADVRAGQSFLNSVYQAVTSGPAWPRTLFVVNYDEWGGFFDHVAPGTAPDAHPDQGLGLRGFRVPNLVVSPRARRGHVAHGVYDHTSVLRAIEWRWNLPPLTPRDAAANNIAEVLDFTTPPNTAAPRFAVPTVVGTPCPPNTPGASPEEEWTAVRALATANGWTLP
ncbi:alkaline phosphatase family protein [Actinomycetospora chiangmaiensis]|uniref:alkaline phosphatase family protein n=1 Tax=Actinomycetospora chiangmaiensis TaxID=402650 RepID=UPI00036F7374|nr:alkaline phosphatase family protein [Actinomycetospora chiangmaiensis]